MFHSHFLTVLVQVRIFVQRLAAAWLVPPELGGINLSVAWQDGASSPSFEICAQGKGLGGSKVWECLMAPTLSKSMRREACSRFFPYIFKINTGCSEEGKTNLHFLGSQATSGINTIQAGLRQNA